MITGFKVGHKYSIDPKVKEEKWFRHCCLSQKDREDNTSLYEKVLKGVTFISYRGIKEDDLELSGGRNKYFEDIRFKEISIIMNIREQLLDFIYEKSLFKQEEFEV